MTIQQRLVMICTFYYRIIYRFLVNEFMMLKHEKQSDKDSVRKVFRALCLKEHCPNHFKPIKI